jgi:hypothetical protein
MGMIPGVAMDNKQQKFYIKTNDGWYLVNGYAIVYKGIRMFGHRDFRIRDGKLSLKRSWRISNYETGLLMCSEFADLDKAIESVVHRIDNLGVDSVREMIENKMRSDGVPPYEGGV